MLKHSYFIILLLSILFLSKNGCSEQISINHGINNLSWKLIYLKNGDVWMHNPFNQEHARLTKIGKISNFEISDEGDKLAYVSEGKLYILNIANNDNKFLTSIQSDRSMPAFSPKNVSILYISNSEKEFKKTKYLARKVRHIWQMDLTENKKVDITKESPFDHTALNFSPDGRFMSYSSYREKAWNVYITELNTDKIKKIGEGICSEWLDNNILAIGDRGKIKLINTSNLSKIKEVVLPSALDPGKFAFFSKDKIFYEAMSDNQDIEIRLIDINTGVYKVIVGNASAPVFVQRYSLK